MKIVSCETCVFWMVDLSSRPCNICYKGSEYKEDETDIESAIKKARKDGYNHALKDVIGLLQNDR